MAPTTEAPAASAPAYSDWQGATGEGWAANAGHYETMLADVGAALLDHAGFAPGERVVEIGCGSGRFARRIAAAVAPGGTVLGLDISPALAQLARQEAVEAGTGNLEILVADAQTAVPPGAPFDRLMSRFGVMFFANPAAAMANLHAMLAPGGRLDFAVWAGIEGNTWAGAVMEVARTHLGLPPRDPRAPGPFAFSDEAYLRTLLAGAGFQAVRFTPWRGKVRFGGPGVSAAEAAGLAVAGGTLAGPIQAAGEEARAALLADLAARMQPYLTDAGVLVPASVHLVTAAAADPARAGTGLEELG
jgi:SAM-dependent methyltransferase